MREKSCLAETENAERLWQFLGGAAGKKKKRRRRKEEERRRGRDCRYFTKIAATHTPVASAGHFRQRARRRVEVRALRRAARRRGAATRTRAYSPSRQQGIWPQSRCGAAACAPPPRTSASARAAARSAPHSPPRPRAAIDAPWPPGGEVKLGARSRREQTWPPRHAATESAVVAPVVGDGVVQHGRERLRPQAPPAVLLTAPPPPLHQLSSPSRRPPVATLHHNGVRRGARQCEGSRARLA